MQKTSLRINEISIISKKLGNPIIDKVIKNPKNLRLIIKNNGDSVVGIARTNTKIPVFIARDTVPFSSETIQEIMNNDITIEICSDSKAVTKVCDVRVFLKMATKGYNFIKDHT